MVETTVSATAVRRLAVAAQGYASRYRRATDSSVEAAIRRLSCVQLDSISTVERSHRIALTSRVGNYPREAVSNLLSQGRIFEFWAHEACLLPIESWPLFRRAMQNGGRDWYSNVNDVTSSHPELANEILGEIRERGPLASRHFEGAAGGGMWNWKPAKAMLERLWNHGDLVIAGRQGFQRVYDLTERVIPRAQLEAPVPSERRGVADARRAGGARRAARSPSRASKEHWRLRGGVARIRPAVDELVAEGRLRRLRVDDGGADVLVAADAELDRPPPRAAVLLSPVRQPALGPAVRAPDPRLRPPDRGLQAGAAAAVRLLRAPVPARRPDRRPRRPEVGAEGGPPGRPRLSP